MSRIEELSIIANSLNEAIHHFNFEAGTIDSRLALTLHRLCNTIDIASPMQHNGANNRTNY